MVDVITLDDRVFYNQHRSQSSFSGNHPHTLLSLVLTPVNGKISRDSVKYPLEGCSV